MEEDSVEPTSAKTESNSGARSATESRSDPKSSSKGKNPSVSETGSGGKGFKGPSSTSQTQSVVTNGPQGTGTATARAARADFFTSPPEPLRLDPFKMFGMERRNPVKEESGSQSKVNGEVKSPVSGAGEVESDEGTDQQVCILQFISEFPNSKQLEYVKLRV